MRIAEYKQISTKAVTEVVRVDDVVDGEVVAWHEETITKEVPVMGIEYRDATPEEEVLASQAEAEAYESNHEPTTEDRIAAMEANQELIAELLLGLME